VSARFAWYGRVSNADLQNPSLSFPSQLKACERRVRELDGEIVAEFRDEESGARSDRPGWTALLHEAKDAATRRFDTVVAYSTSRVSRKQFDALFFERELRTVGVEILFATGAPADPTSAEGILQLQIGRAFDEFERNRLARETKRGLRELAEQGYNTGGRAPYGYRRVGADAGGGRATFEPDPEQAPVVVEIYELFALQGQGFKAIANHLNRPGGPPSPRHVDPKRNVQNRWAASTIRAMLQNLVYTGRRVWNRRDFATPRQNGGGSAKVRAREEWVVAEDSHLPIVSDELFEAAQGRFDGRVRSPGSARAKNDYLFSGMVRCCSGHNPLAMHGKVRKGHHYYACAYASSYGEDAAIEAHGGQKWLSLREDRLLRLVLRFFERRVFGPMRVEKLEKQMRAQDRAQRQDGKLAGTRIRKQVADLDRRIKAQVIALEDGIEPDLVAARISELRGDKSALEEALGGMDGEAEEVEADDLTERLGRLPDLTKALEATTSEVQRQVFQAFDLQITYDKATRRVEVSATVSEAVADAFENAKALRLEGSQVVVEDIAGAGFEPATFGL
jgi:site-specific DNA recombinase